MSFCPKCKCEFVEGIQNCSDCGEELVRELAPDDAEDSNLETEWVKVLNVANEEEAEMVVGMLQSSEIPAMYKSGVTEMIVREPKGADIFVPEDVAEQAVQIICATIPQYAKQNGYAVDETEIVYEENELRDDGTEEDIKQEESSIGESPIVKGGKPSNSRILIRIAAVIILIWFIILGMRYLNNLVIY
ncbi:MAG: hypothetical protein ACM3UU_10235 [Ignavibacteriales bacterium]